MATQRTAAAPTPIQIRPGDLASVADFLTRLGEASMSTSVFLRGSFVVEFPSEDTPAVRVEWLDDNDEMEYVVTGVVTDG